jgi:hypothetical protein
MGRARAHRGADAASANEKYYLRTWTAADHVQHGMKPLVWSSATRRTWIAYLSTRHEQGILAATGLPAPAALLLRRNTASPKYNKDDSDLS